MNKDNKTFSTRVDVDCYNLIKYYISKGVEARELTETAIYVISRMFATYRARAGNKNTFSQDFSDFKAKFQ